MTDSCGELQSPGWPGTAEATATASFATVAGTSSDYRTVCAKCGPKVKVDLLPVQNQKLHKLPGIQAVSKARFMRAGMSGPRGAPLEQHLATRFPAAWVTAQPNQSRRVQRRATHTAKEPQKGLSGLP